MSTPLVDAATPPLRLPAPLWLARQLGRDADDGLFSAWGRSTVVDEQVGAAVVSASAVRELAALARQPDEFPEGNAGLLHVYGYLFSDVATPYGLKSDRWLDGALATALGLDPDAFRPQLAAGDGATMLRRVTDAATAMFDDDSTIARRDAIAPGLTALTALSRAPGASATALGYAIQVPSGIRLVTLFPIGADPRGFLAALDAEPVRLRYNAVAPGGADSTGQR